MKKLIPFLFLTLLFFSCRKEQPPLTPLDCSCANEVSANFFMEEKSGLEVYGILYTDTDSIFADKYVRFRALEENADYTWYIGIDKIKTKEVTKYFPNNMLGQTVPITLVVKKKTNKMCFPFDDGYDSVVKHLTVAQLNLHDNYDTTLIEGHYRMKSDLMNDSVDITIDYVETSIDRYFNIYNYDGQGSNCINNILYFMLRGFNYRQIKIGPASNNCGDLGGSIYVKMGGEVEMNLTKSAYINGEKIIDGKKMNYKGRKL